ncbi:MAG: aminodeoxychorismate synthase component I [Cohaesibacter sp.]|nr:aminodeoxychorismate synthase component I [Cohaesibacter sp.]
MNNILAIQGETIVLPLENPPAAFSLFQRIAHLPFACFLDSASASPQLGRYSYMAAEPFAIFKTIGQQAFWRDKPMDGPPLAALQRLLASFQQSALPDLPPFQGGAMGYFSYEAGRLLEKLPLTSHEDNRLPDILLPFYDCVVAVDHFADGTDQPPRDQAWLLSTGLLPSGHFCPKAAQKRLDQFQNLLSEPEPDLCASPTLQNWKSSKSRLAFEASITRTKDYILAGDIFQANITQKFSHDWTGDLQKAPLALYDNLRRVNAAPFASYFHAGDHVIASSSPERFVILDSYGRVQTRPIKGTAARNLSDPEQDAKNAKALEESEKDRAENIMITDLLRNDLSRVCEPGSIKVPDLCKLESYARVHHLVSTVTGKMKEGLGATALLGAAFPGGSITGAPKIRAMEIISELEDMPRDLYCGSLGYIGFNGAMDTNIAIRTLIIRETDICFNVGGGITALSDPDAEYEECLHKANAIFRACGSDLMTERPNLERGPQAALTTNGANCEEGAPS